jgi:hypothetical protein
VTEDSTNVHANSHKVCAELPRRLTCVLPGSICSPECPHAAIACGSIERDRDTILPLLLTCQLERSLPRWGKDTEATQENSAQPHAVARDIRAVDRAREAHKFGFGQSLQKRGASTRPTSVAAATREHSVRHGTGPTQRAQTVAAGRHLERWTRRMPLAREDRCAVHGCAVSPWLAPRTRPSGPSRRRRRRRPGAAPPSRCSPLRAPLAPGRRRLSDVRHCAPPTISVP